MLLRPYQTDGGKEWFAEGPTLALLEAFRWHESGLGPVSLDPTFHIVEGALAETAARFEFPEAEAQVALICEVLTERLGELLSALRLPALPLKGWLLLEGMHMRADPVGGLAEEVRRAPEPFPNSGSLRDYLMRFPQRSSELCQAYEECFDDVRLLQPYTDDEPPPWAARIPSSRPRRRKS